MNATGKGGWVKGQSGNPNGRARKNGCMTDILRRQLKAKGPDGKPNKEAIVEKIIALANEGVKWAAELCFDRIDGKVTQTLEHTGADGAPIAFTLVLGEQDDDSDA